jgi:hypothetical protein
MTFALDDVLGPDDSVASRPKPLTAGTSVAPSLPAPGDDLVGGDRVARATGISAPFGIASDVSYVSRLTTLTGSGYHAGPRPPRRCAADLGLALRDAGLDSSSTRGDRP